MLPNYKIDPALTPHSQNIVVISNLLPWQLTKPLLYADESDEIPMAFNERRLKKRKSHPDYENLLDLETFCLDSRRELKKNKNFQLHIVGSGIPYGLEEDIFYHWFALGYTNSDLTSLPVVNQGTNLVPTIHINELVKIIGHLVNNPRSVKKAYCIAVDNDSNTLADIVKAVSRLFTKHGAIYHVPLEEFEQTYPKDLVYSLDQKKTALDLLTSHLPVESNFVEDFGKEMNLVQKNFVNNMRNTLKAFLKSHNLKPIKILIHGPPMSGKTELTRKLADYYGLQYLSPLDVLDNRKRYLRKQIKYCDHQIELLNLMNMSENENFDFDVMEEIDRNESNKPEDDSLKSEGDMNLETLSGKLMAYMEELRTLEELASKDRDQYESILRDMYLEVLRRKSVQYHGYVMDGWPDSYEACQLLFAKDKKEGEEEEEEENEESEEEEEDKEEEEGVNRALELVNKNLLPDLVISLEASQDWALSRFIAFMSDHPELFSPKQSLHEMDDRLGLFAPSSTHLFFLSDDMSENENEEVGENRWIRHFVKDYQLFR
ncbi:adenylate kinase 7-like [Diaphorina citri]|uniref:Adenylate kinase 7-like n=1 Tax=Diaphorina citri TaxID=121845 RepID=A0A3Q0J1M7_DIACI|nr:adenylate kinase 7-like [Diaphorina citri]